jgi:hypothetical protein
MSDALHDPPVPTPTNTTSNYTVMSDALHDPPASAPAAANSSQMPRLGDAPGDSDALRGVPGVIEALLRQPRRIVFHLRGNSPSVLVPSLVAIAVAFIAIYGLVVGSFSGGVQWWAAPAKIVAGMMITAAICLPSLYIFACLGGSTARLGEVTGALAGLLALMALLLLGFAPVAWLFSQSTASVATMGFLHLVFWLVATRFGVRFLVGAFEHFELKSRAGLRTWVVIFLLVALQMTTALRPLVGTAETLLPREKKFFVGHWSDWLAAPRR